MIENPFISVIVLCYNQEDTVNRTLNSILNQKTKYSFEIIIGEDASPNDNTYAVCEKYASEYPQIIKLMPKAPNKGLLKNYHDCILHSRGKYIATCAGDDWWHNPEKLQLQAEFLEANEDFGLVYTNFSSINLCSGEYVESVNKFDDSHFPSGRIYRKLIYGNIIAACTVMFRKKLFVEHVDLLSFKELGFFMEDYPMWLEMSQHTKFKYLPIISSTYTIAEASLSNHIEFNKVEEFDGNSLKIRKYYLSKYPLEAVNEENLTDSYHRDLIYKAIRVGNFERVKFYAKKVHCKSLKSFILNIIFRTSLVRIYRKYLLYRSH